jgi:hypothetical protein
MVLIFTDAHEFTPPVFNAKRESEQINGIYDNRDNGDCRQA